MTDDVDDLLDRMTPEERAQLDALLSGPTQLWTPLPGPQSLAYTSDATIIGYGGAAGGGKSELALGLALTKHEVTGIFRQNGTELVGFHDRLTKILGNRDGFNGQANIWRMQRDGRPIQIEFGSFPNAGDEEKHRGRPHDFLVFDEAQSMREKAVRFLLGWLRTTTPGLKVQALLTFNPPSDVEGRWLLRFFAPWIDPKYPRVRAKPGEIRWFAHVPGRGEVEVRNGNPFMVGNERVLPQSRTFIPSRISDNPYLLGTNYEAVLQSLEEPFRSQMLYGDFQAGVEDGAFQVIPTAWVEAAMARWSPIDGKKPPMVSLGVDVARGGRDKTVIARRHAGYWFDEPLRYRGEATVDGPRVAAACIGSVRDGAPIHIDSIGVGSSPFDFLRDAQQNVVGVDVSVKATGLDRSGSIRFFNLRSELWWRMRELLDPKNNEGVALPDDPELLADLTTPTYKLRSGAIYVLGRDEIIKDLGRSPDVGTAYVLSLIDTPSFAVAKALAVPEVEHREHRPLDVLQDIRDDDREVSDYDPRRRL